MIKQVVAAGLDLTIPRGDYHIVALGDLDHDDMIALVAEAANHGAGVAQLEPMYDGDDASFVIMLRVDAAWSVLELGGATVALAGTVKSDAAFVAFGSASSCDGPALGPTSFVLGYVNDRGEQVWEGDSWKIRAHPRAARVAGREWTWRGAGRSFGPYSITLHLEVGREQIETFVAESAPWPYDRIDGSHYEIRDIARLGIESGSLRLLRAPGRGEAADHVAAFDRGLLLALAHGALGPLYWAAFEHDWETPFAIGDDGPSLAEYVLGDRATADATQATLLAPHEIDLTGVAADRVAARLAAALGATESVDDASFDAWLAGRAISHYQIVKLDRLGHWYGRLHAAQPRVVWRISGRTE